MPAVVPDTDYRLKLQVFEGPLDLLLFLIRKNELDIYDIPIEQVTRQYLDALFAMQQLDLDLAGEFFVMAATLMEIKSRMLLPKDLQAVDPNAADEEEMDPRWELVHQLIQYRKFKEAAAQLGELAVERQDMIARYVSSSHRAPRPAPAARRPHRALERLQRRAAAARREAGRRRDPRRAGDRGRPDGDAARPAADRSRGSRFPSSSPRRSACARSSRLSWRCWSSTRLKRLRVRQDEAFADILCEAVTENELETPAAPSTVTA